MSPTAALVELLFQLADDDFLIAYRGSEWLGLAPHIEEDVAFSSISQNTMGHAVAWYHLLEKLGQGRPDELVHLRPSSKFRNGILTERRNGSGNYLVDPEFDWAYAVARMYAYETYKEQRLLSLTHSSDAVVGQLAKKMLPELRYHLMHWDVWVRHLAGGTTESQTRLQDAMGRVWDDIEDLFDWGPDEQDMVDQRLIEPATTVKMRWEQQVVRNIERRVVTEKSSAAGYNGREGRHTSDLEEALSTMSEVYRLDPTANW